MERKLYNFILKDYFHFNTDGTDTKGIAVYDEITNILITEIEGYQLDWFDDEEENELWDYIKDYL
jgi:hypothetical protein